MNMPSDGSPVAQPEPAFVREADSTVWLVRGHCPDVQVWNKWPAPDDLDFTLDDDLRVWATQRHGWPRPMHLMTVGGPEGTPPREVAVVLDDSDPWSAALVEALDEHDDALSVEAIPLRVPELDPDPPGIEDWNDHLERELLALLGKLEPVGSDGRPATLDEILAAPDPQWLIEGLLIENELAFIYGKPKAGKTFAAVDLALCVATGEAFHGLAASPPRPVVYVIAEGNAKLFARRCAAWLDKRGIRNAPNFRILPARVTMNSSAEVRRLIANIDHAALVVIDTFSRTMDGDENSPKDTAAYVAGCDDLRQSTGAAVLVVHHEGKTDGRGPMGHTKISAALDTSIVMRRAETGIVSLRVDQQRNGPGDLTMHFRVVGHGESAVLECVASQRDETDAQFLINDDPDADPVSRVRALAAGMDRMPRGKLEEIIAAKMDLRSAATARRRVDDALPIGAESAVEHEGTRLWLQRVSGRSTVVRAVKTRDTEGEG